MGRVRSGFVRILLPVFLAPLLAVVALSQGAAAQAQRAMAPPAAVAASGGMSAFAVKASDAVRQRAGASAAAVQQPASCSFAGGNVTTDLELTTACGTFTVSSITIFNGATLTIDPGVTLAFADAAQLVVEAGGTLIADASASPSTPIVFTTADTTPAPGDWGRIYFESGSGGALKYATVQYAGFSSLRVAVRIDSASPTLDHVTVSQTNGLGIDLESNAAPTITNSTVSNSSGDGIDVNGGCPTISNTASTNNGGYGLRLNVALTCDPTLSGLTFSGDGNSNRVGLNGTTISGTRTLANIGADYVTTSGFTIANGGFLTVAFGVTLRFAGGVGLAVAAGGTLIADASGHQSTPIVFTTASSSPAPGQWTRIYFESGSGGALKYATVQYGGFNGGDAVEIDSASPTLDHVTVSQTAGAGIYLEDNAAPTITNSTVSNSSGDGIDVVGGCPTISATSSANNAGYGLWLNLALACDPTLSGLTISGNGNSNRVGLSSGTISVVRTLANIGDDYVTTGTITIGNGGKLTIAPGVTLHFGGAQALNVASGGTLVADASANPSTPIIFTTASASPAPGQWYGVQFETGSAGTLKYATVQDAGYSLGYGVRVTSASPTLDHVSFNANSGTNLVMTSNATVIATASNFQSASTGTAVSIDGGTLDARNSYWDNASGPKIASNPSGTGEMISGAGAANVNYAGFTCSPATPTGAPACNATVGGANLTLTSGSPGSVALTWSMLGIQDGYVVLRISPSGEVVLPSGALLPATASSFTDASAAPTYDLYATLPLTSSGGVLGISDLLGYLPNLRTATGVPTNFAITLRQSQTATLTWGPPGGQTGYTLVAIPTDGSAQRTQNLPSSARTATDATGGTPTIYVLVAMNGSAALGNTDGLLAFPGVATVSAPNTITVAPTTARAATAMSALRAQLRERTQAALEQFAPPRLRAALERLRRQAAPAAAQR